jgi:hypothetical protein
VLCPRYPANLGSRADLYSNIYLITQFVALSHNSHELAHTNGHAFPNTVRNDHSFTFGYSYALINTHANRHIQPYANRYPHANPDSDKHSETPNSNSCSSHEYTDAGSSDTD